MDNDIVSLLIYVALALIGVIGSTYKNKAKKQQNASRPHIPEVPRTFKADPPQNYETDLGPLMELFDIPKPKQQPYDYESIEDGPSVEETGMTVESQEASAELAGLEVDDSKSAVDKNVSEIESFEEGQSDIQKMIAKYEAIRKKQEEEDGYENEISKGEIVSVEAEQEIKAKSDSKREQFFDIKKAIIYSEILKRREY